MTANREFHSECQCSLSSYVHKFIYYDFLQLSVQISQLAMYKRLQTRENKSINYFFMNYKMCSQHTHESQHAIADWDFPNCCIFSTFAPQFPLYNKPVCFFIRFCLASSAFNMLNFPVLSRKQGWLEEKWEIFSAFDYEKRKFFIKCVQSACVFSDDSTISFYRSISVVVLTCAKFA